MKSIKNSGLLRLVALVTMIFVVTIFPMRMSEMGKKAAQSYMMKKQQPKKQYFIHEMNDKSKGIWVNKEFVDDNCKSIKVMVEDVGGELNEIPLDLPINVIELVFGVLSDNVDINDLSLTNLISVANAFNFLDVPADKMNFVLAKIKSDLVDKINEKNINEQLKQLHPDLQTALMLDSTNNFLKDFIIKKYAKYRGRLLGDHPSKISAVAFSPDGKYIVSGCDSGGSDNLILWNAETGEKIKGLEGHPGGVKAIAFSPDGKSFASGGRSGLIVWDISNIHDIIPYPVPMDNIVSIEFSPSGKSFVSGGMTGLILWDISNPNNIDSKELYQESVTAMAVSSDGQYIISTNEFTGNLILWDISNLDHITKHVIDIGNEKCRLVAFNPDGKNFVSYNYEDTIVLFSVPKEKYSLRLWDISNPEEISCKLLDTTGFQIGNEVMIFGRIASLVFSHEGKKIALGNGYGCTLLDVYDPNDRLVFNPGAVSALAFSPGDKQIIMGVKTSIFAEFQEYRLALWTILTDQEETLLKELKNYTADQIRLIYTFCLKALKGEKISLKSDSEEQDIFMTLPKDMQQLLKGLFFSQGWFSGWR